MYLLLIFCTSTLFSFAFCATISRRWDSEDVITRHEWRETPAGYEDHGPAPGNVVLNLRIGLASAGFDSLLQHLNVASDPDHEKYVITILKFLFLSLILFM